MGAAGNLYVTGPFWSPSVTLGSSVIADPYGSGGYVGGGIGGGGTPLAYIAEFSPAGTALWGQAAGGSNGAYGMGVVSDAAGNVYMTGGFGDASISFGAVTVNKTYPSNTALALYLVQYSPSHAVTWSKTIGSATQGLWGFAIALAACGEVWVSGDYTEDADVDGHTLALVPGTDPVFIAGYNLSGGVIGYSGLGSGGDDQNGIACDPNGNVFICSDYQSTGTFAVGPDVLSAGTSGDEYFYMGKYANIAIGASDTTYHTMDTTLCNLSGITLSGPAGYGAYLWDNAATTQTRFVANSGNYWLVCRSTCSIPTIIDTFHVIISPTDTTHGSKDTAVCAASAATVTLTGEPGFSSYIWNTGSTATSISVTAAGLYWLTESNGCALRSDTFNISISPAPAVTLGNDTSLCAGNTVRLYCPEPAGVTYQWSTGGTDTAIYVTESGDYGLTVNAKGCTASASIKVKFTIPPDAVKVGPDTTLCDETQFTITSGNNATVWNTGQRGANLTVYYPGLYIATARNECGLSSDSIRVDFAHCLITIPNAFTPNNDGKNDVFKVVGVLLGDFSNFSLSVFNRYGQRVFYTQNIEAGWDGTFNGTPQDLGTYFYMVLYSLNGKSHMLKGDFELVR